MVDQFFVVPIASQRIHPRLHKQVDHAVGTLSLAFLQTLGRGQRERDLEPPYGERASGPTPRCLDNTRLLALMNLALVDAYIACWDAKFHYNFWRPITAIRDADTDGNPATAADSQWTLSAN